jgi:hypothetical protein
VDIALPFTSATGWCSSQLRFTLFMLEAIRNGSDDMRMQINRVSGKVLIVLSLTALLAVFSGYTQPPQPDEGTAAHIFQVSIVALAPMIVLFLATADWRQPLQSVARPLAIAVAALVLAFGALHYLEQYRY